MNSNKIATPPPNASYPAVSVVIPFYNVEKYIGDGLESLLMQTFQNFEVIAVDDGSTDSTPAVVESFIPKFGGRLRLAKLKRHSGGATEPRNMGISLSRGEYLFFLDSDDSIMPTGLEEMYALAKKYSADVVHCEKLYSLPENLYHDAEQRKNLKPAAFWPAGDKTFIKAPTLLTEDLEKRTTDFCQRWLTWSVQLQLIRRDYIVENNLRFAGLICEDLLFTLCEICSAKKYLVVPNVVYLHRGRSGSFMWRDSDHVEKFLVSRLVSLKDGVRYLDDFLNDFEPFAQRPDLRFMLFNMFTKDLIDHLINIYSQVPAPALDKILRKEFSDGDNVALSSFFFSMMNIWRLQLMKAQQRVAELEAELKRKELLPYGETNLLHPPQCILSSRLDYYPAVQRRKIYWRLLRQYSRADVPKF